MEYSQINLFEASYDKPTLPKHIRLIEFFAGIGAQAKALEILNADFECWRTCEWSWQSITAYNAIHHNGEVRDTSNLSYDEVLRRISGVSNDYCSPMTEKQLRAKGEKWARDLLGRMIANKNFCPDVSRIHASDLGIENRENNTYVLTYSFPCGLPGAKVKTRDGYKKIEDVAVGDEVLTCFGRYRKVDDVMTKITQSYYKIKAVGAFNLNLTGNHPLYILRDGEMQWVPASLVKEGDFIIYNVNKESTDVELSDSMLWLLGRYVADGWINQYLYNSVEIAVAYEKEEEFLKNSPEEFIGRWRKFQKSAIEYRIADKDFQNLCRQFGNGAKNKRIPQWVIDLPKDRLLKFIEGYLSGDGHIRYLGKTKQIMFSTASEDLCLGLQDCFIKAFRAIPTISVRHDSRKATFSDTYNGQLNLSERHTCQSFDGDYAYGKVKSVEEITEQTPVFNLSVEEDQSYTLFNVIVHNCQDLSNAGLQKGMEKGSGTRSGLLWEVERILLECRESDSLPQVLVMENVPAVCGSNNAKPWNEWLDALHRMGYTNYWRILNAKDYGIPQNRRRCFMVSILGQASYTFPRKQRLKYLLKDFIDRNVPEEYFLSEDTVRMFRAHSDKQQAKGNGFKFEPTDGNGVAGTITTREGQRTDDNFLIIPSATEKGYMEAHAGDGVLPSWKGARGTVQPGMVPTILTSPDTIGVVVETTKTEADE